GNYHFDYKPEKCTLLVALESAPTAVSADLTLPRVSLAAGVLVKGLVTDTRGAPVDDVNTSYFGSNGLQVLTWNDHTDPTGAYSAVVLPGDTYAIEYAPPVGLRLAGVKSTGIAIGNNPPPLPTVQLPDGFFVTGKNVTLGGAPIFDVDINFFLAGTTTKVYVSHHHTDAAGNFSIVSVPGTYDIRFEPPTSALAARRLLGIGVT
ncbi:MAG: hypothetical protein DMF50_00615, partial [Acidobacteria bacterium]